MDLLVSGLHFIAGESQSLLSLTVLGRRGAKGKWALEYWHLFLSKPRCLSQRVDCWL